MKITYYLKSFQPIILGIFLILVLAKCTNKEEQKIHDKIEMKNVSVFKTPEAETRYISAYNAILTRWPVPYAELNIQTRFGKTHIIASGSTDKKPLFFLHVMDGSAMQWLRNVSGLSKHYRVYAVDIKTE